MKFPVKMTMLAMLAALMLAGPASGAAQGLPAFAQAAAQGIGDGLMQGVEQAIAAMEEDLSLALETDSPRLEPGRGVTLRLTAKNPRLQETKVTFTLKLPGRVACDQADVWEATLPAAAVNAQTGDIEPGVAAFERTLTLADDGESESVTLEAEMAVGARFYRANAPLMLCLPDVSAQASVEGAQDGRIQPGMPFAYRVTIENAGAAAKAMQVELIVPPGVQLAGALPAGFEANGSSIAGEVVAAQAGEDGKPSCLTLAFPMRVSDDALADDADATRLLTGALRVDGARVALPRVLACGPMISARLVADAQSVQAGEAMTLRVMVFNSGLAGADVRVRCALPDGLALSAAQEDASAADETQEDADAADEAGAQEDADEADDEDDKAAALPGDGGAPGAGEAVAAVAGGELVYDLYMEPAQERDDGMLASTRVIEIPVTARETMEQVDEKLLGATLAWSVGGGEAQLGEAVAVRVYKPQFLGIEAEQWVGILFAGLLLMATVAAMFFALRSRDTHEDCVFD